MKLLEMKMLNVFVAGCLAATVSHAGAADINSGAFTLTGAMSTERSLHTATLLADGRVLVVGGVNAAGETLDSAEIYDPGSGEFTLIGGILGTARFGSAAARLLDGRVLIVGGEDSTHTSITSVEIFDPSTNIFSSTGSLGTSRLNPTVTLLESTGSVLVVGGYEGTSDGTPLASAELYDPVSGGFTPTGSMKTGRRNHTATTLPNSTVLIAGGYNGSNVNDPEIYDPGSGEFTLTGTMSAARRYPTATLLPDDTVLMAGGYDNKDGTSVVLGSAEFYDADAQSFTLTGSLLTPRGRHTATLLLDGTVLIAGGYGDDVLASAELYDPVTGEFFAAGSMSEKRWRHTETLLENGDVLIIGGSKFPGDTPGGALSSAELYSVVPEPSTAALVMVCATGHFLRRRYRRRAVLPA